MKVFEGCLLILTVLSIVKGSVHSYCYYIYQPLFEHNVTTATYEITADDLYQNASVIIDDGDPQELSMCNSNVTCCHLPTDLFDNITTRYSKVCSNQDIQIQITVNDSMYKSPSQVGTEYYVYCGFSGFMCSFLLGFVDYSANVTLIFMNDTLSYNLTMNTNILISETMVEIILTSQNRYVEFTCDCDLTGVSITSTADIILFSVLQHNSYVMTINPLPPVNVWEKEYTFLSMNNKNVTENIVIITSQENTYIKIPGQAIVNVPRKGSYVHVGFQDSIVLQIKASFPVLAINTGKSSNTGIISVINVYPPPINKQMCISNKGLVYGYFIFENGNGSYEIICSYGQLISSTVKEVTLGGTTHTISNIVVNTNSSDCIITTNGSSQGYVRIGTSMTYMEVGFIVNNETEEDYSYPNSLYNSDQNDTTADSYGTTFVLSTLASSMIKLFIVCTNQTNVTVEIVGQNGTTYDWLFCNDTELSYSVEINATNEHIILIKSLQEISVSVIGVQSVGLFSYLALPINTMGYEYFVISYLDEQDYFTKQWSSCIGVALYTSTNVIIRLKTGMQSVVYNGMSVNFTDIRTTMNEYQTFSLESPTTDMTGVYIKSDKPLQLYCGGYSNSSVFYEQLIPTNTFGFRFHLKDMNNVNGFNQCVYRLTSSDINTSIKVDDLNGNVYVYNISRAEFIELPPNLYQVTSNLGLLVILICKSDSGDISMSMVPSKKHHMAAPIKPSDDSFSTIFIKQRTVFYRDGTKIAAHVAAMKISTIACPFNDIGTGTLDTTNCFYGDNNNNSSSGNQACAVCDCPSTYLPSNMTIQERIDELVRLLTVDKTTLSSYINARISAPDPRPSARGIGSVAAIILAILILFLLVSDAPLLVIHFKLVMVNLSDGLRRFRGKGQ